MVKVSRSKKRMQTGKLKCLPRVLEASQLREKRALDDLDGQQIFAKAWNHRLLTRKGVCMVHVSFLSRIAHLRFLTQCGKSILSFSEMTHGTHIHQHYLTHVQDFSSLAMVPMVFVFLNPYYLIPIVLALKTNAEYLYLVFQTNTSLGNPTSPT